MRGRKGFESQRERNKRDYLIRKGVLPPTHYEKNLETALIKAGL